MKLPGSGLKTVILARIFIIAFAGCLVFERFHLNKVSPHLSARKNEPERPYRNAPKTRESDEVFPYEFYKSKDQPGPYLHCSAIIRTIDATRDDYKTYCRSVVADIIKTAGTDKLEINIYDDYEAWELAEVKFNEKIQMLTREESDSVDKHTVANYYGDRYGSDYSNVHMLFFYAQAKDRYSAQEIFMP